MSDYSELLKDPRWQRKRLEVMLAANFTCEDCGRSDLTLEVHHNAYIRGKQPWEYGNDLLMCLCEDCHPERQRFETAARVSLSRLMRHMEPNRLRDETWRLIGDVSERETQRYAGVFN